MNHLLSVVCLFGSLLSVLASVAHADPQSVQQRRKALLPLVRVTTDCITTQVAHELGNAAQLDLTIRQRVDRVWEGGSCFPHLRLLLDQHDRLLGPGSGEAFVNGPYRTDLPRAVSVRLQTASKGIADGQPFSIQPTRSQTSDALPVAAPRAVLSERDRTTLVPATSIQPQQVSATASDRIKGAVDGDAFRHALNLIFMTLAASTVILFVLGCGSRVVVFADASDLFMSASIFIVPMMTLFGAGMIGWMLAPENPPKYATTLEMAFDNPAPTFVLCVGAIAWGWAVFGTIFNSIRYNGIIVGLVIAALKLGAILSLMLVWLGTLHNYDEEKDDTHIAAKFFIFAILVWLASKFVNGERVMVKHATRKFRRWKLAAFVAV